MTTYYSLKSEKDSLDIALMANEMSCYSIYGVPIWRCPQIIANVNLRYRARDYLLLNQLLYLNEVILYPVPNRVPQLDKIVSHQAV